MMDIKTSINEVRTIVFEFLDQRRIVIQPPDFRIIKCAIGVGIIRPNNKSYSLRVGNGSDYKPTS